VLALIGLMGAMLVGGTGRLLSARDNDPETRILAAITAARLQAVQSGQSVELPAEPAEPAGRGSARARFLPVVSESSSLIGGELHEEALRVVRFHADGTCDPFRLEITGPDRGRRRILTIDPWSCAVLASGNTAYER